METRLKRTLNCITSLPNGVRVKSKLITLVPADKGHVTGASKSQSSLPLRLVCFVSH